MVPRAEVEKRISGLQSALAKDANKKLDSVRAEYQAKLDDLSKQLKTKDEELTRAASEVTSLTEKLESAINDNKELTAKSSALDAELQKRTEALARLNASVLTPGDSPESWRNLHGKAFWDWLKQHPNAK